MEQLIFILGIFQKEFLGIPFIPQLLVFSVAILIYRRIVDKVPLEPLDNVSIPQFTFFVMVIIGQVLAFWGLLSEGYSLSTVIKKALIAVIFVTVIFLSYLVISNLMVDECQVRNIVTGNFWALLILLGICGIQIIFVFSPGNLGSLVDMIGHIEYHNPLNQGSFVLGSFTRSTLRVNGLYGESGFLAGIIGACFVPFILGAIRNRVNVFFPQHRYYALAYYALLGAVLLVLLLAKTSTGILAIAIVMVLLLFSQKTRKSSSLLLGGYLILAGGFGIALMKIPALYDMFMQFTVGKTNSDSTTMRLLATIAVLKTAVSHPLVGVGYGQTSHFNFLNAPSDVKKLEEYQRFLDAKDFPDQSAWGSVLAQFGLLLSILAVIYVIHLLIDLQKQAHVISIKIPTDDGYDQTIADSAIFFIALYGILGILSIQWSFELFIMMFFFFAGYRQYLHRKITGLSKGM